MFSRSYGGRQLTLIILKQIFEVKPIAAVDSKFWKKTSILTNPIKGVIGGIDFSYVIRQVGQLYVVFRDCEA